jgi:Glycosyl hydrolases family 39
MVLCGCVALCQSLSSADDIKAPPGTLIEAEANLGSDSKVIDDAAASGGKFVENAKDWQPLMNLSTPADASARVTIHIRHKGGPIQLKTTDAAGKQTDRSWVWDKPAEWKWSKIGTFNKADLGEKFLLMRGGGGGTIALDAIVLEVAAVSDAGPVLPGDVVATGATGTLPPSQPDASIAASKVDVFIDWNQTVAVAPAKLWGVNDYEVHNPKTAADVGFNAFMKELNSPFIRVHRGDFPKQYLNSDGKTFDIAKMKECWAAVKDSYGDAVIKINISSWPEYMRDEKGFVKTEYHEEYIKMCIELMRIFRDELNVKVTYWEVMNEKDGGFDKINRLNEVVQLYVKTVRAMKQFDPSAQVGGFAFTWANPKWVETFIKEGGVDASDFVTYHNYGIGEITDSNEKLFGTLNAVEKNSRYIRSAIDTAAAGRRVPIYLNEYNVKWVWNPIEPRHGNSVGAAFQACLLRRAALAGIDGANVWHVKGDAYGLIGNNNERRLTAPLYVWGPQFLVGNVASHQSGDLAKLELLPVVRNDGKRALLLINKANHSVVVPAPSTLMGESLVAHQVNSDKEVNGLTIDSAQPLSLPGYSLTLLVQQ